MKGFYLASHDYISSPEPRACTVVREVKIADKYMFLVEVFPELPGRLVNSQSDIQHVFLSLCSEKYTLDKIGKVQVAAHIYYAADVDSSHLSKRDLIRIGTGSLHSLITEATKHSPI